MIIKINIFIHVISSSIIICNIVFQVYTNRIKYYSQLAGLLVNRYSFILTTAGTNGTYCCGLMLMQCNKVNVKTKQINNKQQSKCQILHEPYINFWYCIFQTMETNIIKKYKKIKSLKNRGLPLYIGTIIVKQLLVSNFGMVLY